MTDAKKPTSAKRAPLIGGGLIGNILEWYDFTVYGFFAATLGKLFFPSAQPGVSLIAAFGVYAAGFLMRPLGGVVFGYVGDLVGRKRVLTVTVALMAVSTTLIGVLPTYAEIGIAAPLLLLLLRIVQGLAAAGEMPGSFVYLIESGPDDERGVFGSITLLGAFLGILAGSALGALITGSVSGAALEGWAWRLPFLAGSVLGIVGLALRRKLQELPPLGEPAASPVVEVIKTCRRELLQGFGIVLVFGVSFVLMFVYIVTWLRQQTHEPQAEILATNSISMVVLVAVTLAAAKLSDGIGRKPLLLFASAGLTAFAYPLLWLMHHDSLAMILCGQLGFALFIGAISGVMPATLGELFPRRVRVSAVALGYNVPMALFSGTAPLVGAWLVTTTGDAMAIAWYLMVVGLLGLTTALTLRETKGAALAS